MSVPSRPPGATPPATTALRMRQRLTMMINRYELYAVDASGAEGALVAFAEQKRLALKEQVTFYADTAKTTPLFGFKARQVLDAGATYDVTDAHGIPIGWFKKEFGASLARSTWTLGTADGFTARGQERNAKIAVLRRVWDFIPLLSEVPVPFLFHFDFQGPDGQIVLSSTKRMALRDVYELTVPTVSGRQLDWRMVCAVAVALDALQSR